MQLSSEDHTAISSAIRAAEQRTSGQIVCVLAHASSEYAHVPNPVGECTGTLRTLAANSFH